MRSKCVLLFSLVSLSFGEETTKLDELRILSKKAQNDEKAISRLKQEIKSIKSQEQTSAPIVKSVYDVLTRCFTLLYNIERYAPILRLSQINNSTDYVRCSMIIKNFELYFDKIKDQLNRNSTEIIGFQENLKNRMTNLDNAQKDYAKTIVEIDKIANGISSASDEGLIQNDMIYHIAAKSDSLEELDAELEAENALGVLKNTKVSTSLILEYPVAGRLVGEFGDKSPTKEMELATSFETLPEAIVSSPAKGIILFAGPFLNYGNMIIISNGEYRIFLYGLDKIFVNVGDTVEIGSYIGKMPNKDAPLLKMELKRSGEALDAHDMILETSRKENI